MRPIIWTASGATTRAARESSAPSATGNSRARLSLRKTSESGDCPQADATLQGRHGFLRQAGRNLGYAPEGPAYCPHGLCLRGKSGGDGEPQHPLRRPGDSGGRAYAGLRPALYNIAPQPGQHGRCRGLPYRGDYRIPCKHLLRLPPVWEDEERQSDKVSVIKCFMTTVRIVEIKNYGYLYSQQ